MAAEDLGNQFLRVVVRGRPSWLLFMDGVGDIWCYLGNDQRFHRNWAVYEDIQFEHRNEYVRLTVAEAAEVAKDATIFPDDDYTKIGIQREESLSLEQVLRLHHGESTYEAPLPGVPSPWDEEVKRRLFGDPDAPRTPDGAPPLPGVDGHHA